MLYRLAAMAIVAFWIVMMVLLIRLETHPEETDLLDVPPSYVMGIMFKHKQQSLLTVNDDEKPIGTISLLPSITGSNGRLLNFSSTLTLQMPASRQRINFNGALNFDAALHLTGFRVDLYTQQPHYHLNVKGDTAAKTLACQLLQDNHVMLSETLPMDSSSFGPMLSQSVGLDPNSLPISTSNITPPTVTARETKITLRGEQLQVYEVSVHDGATATVDYYVTQLGQVILAKTNFGYTFAAEEY